MKIKKCPSRSPIATKLQKRGVGHLREAIQGEHEQESLSPGEVERGEGGFAGNLVAAVRATLGQHGDAHRDQGLHIAEDCPSRHTKLVAEGLGGPATLLASV